MAGKSAEDKVGIKAQEQLLVIKEVQKIYESRTDLDCSIKRISKEVYLRPSA